MVVTFNLIENFSLNPSVLNKYTCVLKKTPQSLVVRRVYVQTKQRPIFSNVRRLPILVFGQEKNIKNSFKIFEKVFAYFLLGIMFGKKYILSLGLINLLIVQNYRITVQPILDFFPICSCLIQVKSFTDITLESRRTSASTSLFVNYEFNFRVKKHRGQTSRKTRTSFKKLFHYSFLFLLKVVFQTQPDITSLILRQS